MPFKRPALVIVLSLVAGWQAVGGEIVDRIVAVVDRHAITLSEAEQALALRRLRGGDELALADVVERLIEAYLIEREVQRYPVEPIPREEVEKAVDALRAALGSGEQLEQALRLQAMDLEALEGLVRKQLRVERYLDHRFRSLVYVTDQEIERYYEQDLAASLRSKGQRVPQLQLVAEQIRRILVERKFNERVSRWINELKSRARIRRYVW